MPPRTYEWKEQGGSLGNSAELTRAAANILSGMTDGWSDALEREYNRKDAVDQQNLASATNANTASLIDAIRQGKKIDPTGPYDAMKVADARYEYQKNQQASAQQAARRRAAAAGGGSGGSIDFSGIFDNVGAEEMPIAKKEVFQELEPGGLRVGGSAPATTEAVMPTVPTVPTSTPAAIDPTIPAQGNDALTSMLNKYNVANPGSRENVLNAIYSKPEETTVQPQMLNSIDPLAAPSIAPMQEPPMDTQTTISNNDNVVSPEVSQKAFDRIVDTDMDANNRGSEQIARNMYKNILNDNKANTDIEKALNDPDPSALTTTLNNIKTSKEKFIENAKKEATQTKKTAKTPAQSAYVTALDKVVKNMQTTQKWYDKSMDQLESQYAKARATINKSGLSKTAKKNAIYDLKAVYDGKKASLTRKYDSRTKLNEAEKLRLDAEKEKQTALEKSLEAKRKIDNKVKEAVALGKGHMVNGKYVPYPKDNNGNRKKGNNNLTTTDITSAVKDYYKAGNDDYGTFDDADTKKLANALTKFNTFNSKNKKYDKITKTDFLNFLQENSGITGFFDPEDSFPIENDRPGIDTSSDELYKELIKWANRNKRKK